MAWYDRLTNAVQRIATSIGRTLAGTGGPQPIPDYGEEEPEEEPIVWEDPYDEEYGRFGEEIELLDALGEPIGSHTKEEWFQELLKPQEELLYEYGYGNIDLIYALQEAGYWDDYDWETWRELYDSL